MAVILASGIDTRCPDKNGNLALHIAALSGNSEIIRMLCEAGLPINERNNAGESPMHSAIHSKSLHAFKLLVRRYGKYL